MAFQGDSIYWVEVEKVVPNPFQPRREFDESKLQDLADSIRMYGVLQPLTVTRQEVQNEDGTFFSRYELIAGERRLRASRLAGVAQVPVIIREGEDSEQEKLELAIIENLQREDLNAIDRALAFQQLAEQFELNHTQVGKKVGRSREYVANSIRLLQLPEHMRDSVRRGELGEGHARTLLMLSDKPEEQETLFREVLLKKMSVRELERISRKIATDKVRKPNKADIDQHLIEIEKEFTETLGTRVQILKTDFGGKLTIDYFSEDDLAALLQRVQQEQAANTAEPVFHTPLPAAPAPVSDPAPATTPAAAAVSAPLAAAGVTAAVEAPTHTPTEVVSAPAAPSVAADTTSAPSAPPVAEPAPVPATHAHSTAPVAQQPDQSLLERLSAHTPLSFGAGAAAAGAPVDTPSAAPTPPPPPAATAEAPGEQPSPAPSVNKDVDDDALYSLRNFTV